MRRPRRPAPLNPGPALPRDLGDAARTVSVDDEVGPVKGPRPRAAVRPPHPTIAGSGCGGCGSPWDTITDWYEPNGARGWRTIRGPRASCPSGEWTDPHRRERRLHPRNDPDVRRHIGTALQPGVPLTGRLAGCWLPPASTASRLVKPSSGGDLSVILTVTAPRIEQPRGTIYRPTSSTRMGAPSSQALTPSAPQSLRTSMISSMLAPWPSAP